MFLALSELLHKFRTSLPVCGPEERCQGLKGKKRTLAYPLPPWKEGPSERRQRCSSSVQTRGLVFARSFGIMWGEVVHEWCDGIIADHEFPVQLVRDCCVGVSFNWTSPEPSRFIYHFTSIGSQGRRGQHVELQQPFMKQSSSSLTFDSPFPALCLCISL